MTIRKGQKIARVGKVRKQFVEIFNSLPINHTFRGSDFRNMFIERHDMIVTYSYIVKLLKSLIEINVLIQLDKTGYRRRFQKMTNVKIFKENGEVFLRADITTKPKENSLISAVPVVPDEFVINVPGVEDPTKKLSAQCVEMVKEIITLKQEVENLQKQLEHANSLQAIPEWVDEFISELRSAAGMN
jgi:regulator of replication initiation timing